MGRGVWGVIHRKKANPCLVLKKTSPIFRLATFITKKKVQERMEDEHTITPNISSQFDISLLFISKRPVANIIFFIAHKDLYVCYLKFYSDFKFISTAPPPH